MLARGAMPRPAGLLPPTTSRALGARLPAGPGLLVAVLASIALGLPLTLCMQGCDITATPVSRVVADPFRYQGRSVSVRGVVGWSGDVPLVGRRGFTLEQDGSKLLVLSERPSPPIGTRIKVAGHFEASFDLGERFAPVLLDEDPGPRRDGGASDVR